MQKVNNVFEAILKYGHDEDFAPAAESARFQPTDAPAGSQAKIDELRRRVDRVTSIDAGGFDSDIPECDIWVVLAGNLD